MYRILNQRFMCICLLAVLFCSGCTRVNKEDSIKENSLDSTVGKVNDLEENEVENNKMEENELMSKNEKVILETELLEDDKEIFEKANGWSNGFMFDCTWRESNVTFSNGVMNLSIDKDGVNSKPMWSGGEYRSKEFYHYGKYEVRMKPIKNKGVVSSFFTYTGPSDNNPWDEIDIEFLGKDTTIVQFNYFTSGIGEHEYIHELGFDASNEFHTYGFLWLADSITWYVDGVEVHKATDNIPVTKSKLMMNVWPGIGVDSWLDAYDGTTPLKAEYDWFRYSSITE